MDDTPRATRRRWLVPLLLVVVLAQAVWIGWSPARRLVLQLETTPAERGHRLALQLGCFSCHGPEGTGGTKNPKSQEGEVPAFVEQTQMMYVKTNDDLRQYILDGAPKRRLDDPDYVAKVSAAALRMPSYRPFVSAADVDDLVAFLRSTSGQIIPDEAGAAKGGELAHELGCFACHGPLGSGGVANPGSFKGYIPGFWGSDYAELVESDDELRAWIGDGKMDRISEHPIGRIFFRRQAIKMPSYAKFVPAEDITALMAYVKWIHAGSWHPLIQ